MSTSLCLRVAIPLTAVLPLVLAASASAQGYRLNGDLALGDDSGSVEDYVVDRLGGRVDVASEPGVGGAVA